MISIIRNLAYSLTNTRLVFCLCLFAILTKTAFAEENRLSLKPARCVALHEGQRCYQTVSITWHTAIKETLCIYQQNVSEPLTCWDNQDSGTMKIDFEESSTTTFYLQRMQDNKVLSEVAFEVAWVYDTRSHRDSHWRIF